MDRSLDKVIWILKIGLNEIKSCDEKGDYFASNLRSLPFFSFQNSMFQSETGFLTRIHGIMFVWNFTGINKGLKFLVLVLPADKIVSFLKKSAALFCLPLTHVFVCVVGILFSYTTKPVLLFFSVINFMYPEK